MAPKHDRSTSDQSLHLEARRRELRAERNRRYRDRQRALHSINPEPRPEQLQEGEQIVDLAITEEEAAAVTLTQLGLRVQGIALAQGDRGTEVHTQTINVDEYERLHLDHSTTSNIGKAKHTPPDFFKRFTIPKSLEAESSRQAQQRPLSQFFRTLPARSPSIPYVPLEDTEPQNVSTPLHDLRRSRSDSRSLSANIEQQNNGNINIGSADETHYEEQALPSGADKENVNQEPPQQIEDSDEESAYSFASEHSTDNGEEGEIDIEVAATVYVADKLYEQLVVNFHGCSIEEHDEASREHLQAAGDNHHGLNEVFNDPDFPSVLGLKEMISARRLTEQQQPSPTQ